MKNPSCGRKAVIIGGAGFIASHLCDELLTHDVAVRLFSRKGATNTSIAHLHGRVDHIQGDMGRADDLARALAGMDDVYHLVSATSPGSGDRDPAFDAAQNILGTVRLLEECVRARVRRVIYVSSGGTVYGMPRQLPIPEEHPLEPFNAYGIGKVASERYMALFERLHGLQHRVLRVANAYGERQRADRGQGIVAVWLHRTLNAQPMEIWGDGSVVRDLVHAADVARALRLASDHEGSQRVFNIGSGSGTSLLQLGRLLESVTIGHRSPVLFVPPHGEDVPINVLDISRARVELGWLPQVDLRSGIERTWHWLMKEHAEFVPGSTATTP